MLAPTEYFFLEGQSWQTPQPLLWSRITTVIIIIIDIEILISINKDLINAPHRRLFEAPAHIVVVVDSEVIAQITPKIDHFLALGLRRGRLLAIAVIPSASCTLCGQFELDEVQRQGAELHLPVVEVRRN
jgi:hypothetical protein